MFLPNVKNKEEFLDILTLLYRVCKHSLQLKAHHPETHEVIQRNQRMGISLSGILQASKEQLSWLDEGYRYLRDFDKRYSEINGFRPSIKLTTVQPSGTLALLPGVTPGIHPGYGQYMIRRITIAADHELVSLCREHGYPVDYKLNIDGSRDYNSVVVSFPFSYPEGTILADEMTAVSQLEWIRRMQAEWSDNAVSCTIYYKKEELPEIREYLAKHYRNNHKSLSFLLHTGHGFIQAPYEIITKEAYDELVSKVTPIGRVATAEFDGGDECASGVCPVR